MTLQHVKGEGGHLTRNKQKCHRSLQGWQSGKAGAILDESAAEQWNFFPNGMMTPKYHNSQIKRALTVLSM